MKLGLVELLGKLRLVKGSNHIELQPPASIPSNYTLTLPASLPGSTQALASDTSGAMSWVSVAGGAHTQNTDTGTTSTTFQIDNDASGPLLKNNAGGLEVRNASDTGYADIVVGNVTVKGSSTVIESNTLAIGDNVIVLNQEYTGSTPTENGGIEIERGTVTSAALTWDEANDRWAAGLAGSEIPIARVFRTTFTNASLTAGVLTITHNLGHQDVQVVIRDNNNRKILPDEDTTTSANACTIDLTSYGTLTGTWRAIVCG